MKLKRHLPLIVFILLSCAVIIGTPVYFFINLLGQTYPVDMSTKISLALRQGLGVAAVIVVLAWIGAGVDFGLSRIKKRTARIFISLITYLAPLILCSLLTVLIFLITGSLEPPTGWKKLPTPPAVPSEIAAVGEESVYILTESGSYYYCWIKTPSMCWEATDKPAKRIIQNDSGTLGESFNEPSSNPPGDVLSMIGVKYNDFGTEVQVHYAVLGDGTVHYLEKNAGKAESNFGLGLLLSIIILPAVIALFGVYIGAGISAILRWLASRLPGPDTLEKEIQ